jgi:hypothetical protein
MLRTRGEADGAGGAAVVSLFDPDPLYSPLRAVLGQCRQLKAHADVRSVVGEAAVRGVEARLSPRAAVAAAVAALAGEGR